MKKNCKKKKNLRWNEETLSWCVVCCCVISEPKKRFLLSIDCGCRSEFNWDRMKRDDLSLVWTERFSQWGGGGAAAGNELNLKIREVCTSAHIEGVLVHIGGFFFLKILKLTFWIEGRSTKVEKSKLERWPFFLVFIYFFFSFGFFWWKLLLFFFCKRNKYWFFFVKYERGSERERERERDVSTVRSDLFPSYVFCPTIAFNSPWIIFLKQSIYACRRRLI